MAAAIKALNAKIRSNPTTDYLCSTHFWGPASNFGIPIAAVADTQKDPDIISGKMTLALTGYSSVFMRYAFAVTPKNYLLFACHSVNFTAQVTQGYRYIQYWHMGGRDQSLKANAQDAASGVSEEASKLADEAKVGMEKAEGKMKQGIEKVKGQ